MKRSPAPLPEPDGPIRYLLDPAALLRDVLHALEVFARKGLPWVELAVVTGTVLLVTWRLLVVWRDRRLRDGARRVRILPPPQVDPQQARLLWMSLHALLRPWGKRIVLGQPHLGLELVGRPEEIEVALWVPSDVPMGLVERAVEVAFPGARTEVAEADPLAELSRSDGHLEVCEFGLAEPEWFPVGGGPGDDPLSLALAALTGLGEDEGALVQVLARPLTSRARYRLVRAARVLRAGGKPGRLAWRTGRGAAAGRPAPDPTLETDIRAILAKAASPLWACTLRVAVCSDDRGQARGRIHGLAGALAVFEGHNGFRRHRAHGARRVMLARRLGRLVVLSVPELAQIATVPAAGAVAGLDRAGAKTAAPSRLLPAAGRILGYADHSGVRRPVAIATEDSRHHLHVVGETGTGKSTLLANLVLQDAEAGRAAVVIDPKGDLVESILERLPAGCEERTCVIDPNDRRDAVGLNVLAGSDPDLIVDHVAGVFKRIYEPWWGPRTDDIMRAACLTLAQIPGATLAEVPWLLTDFDWRRAIRERLGDVGGLSAFWSWYERLPEQQRAQHIAPLLNKLRSFLLRGPVAAVVGQAAPKRDIESLIDEGGLLLVRVPKGTLGEDTSRLLGAFVVARVWQRCMRRASIPEEQRPDATLYVDETHNYLALPRSFEDLLAEARGYRLSLVLAHQHMGQLPRDVRDALGANARTKVVFTCSPEDALALERHFDPDLSAYDLSHLATFQAACRPCVGGGQSQAFTFRTEPLPAGSRARAEAVRRRSAALFATPRDEVEETIESRQLERSRTLLPPRLDEVARKRHERSLGRSPERSFERSPERSSPLDPGARIPPGERA
jgi:Type IV secretion-system coupling protein DNA-binding domain